MRFPARAQHTKLPVLRLFSRDGAPVVIEPATLSGKVVLIDFFASWCTACEEEHRTLLELAHTSNAPVMLGIAWNDTISRADDWLAQHRDPYTRVLFDRDGKAAIALGLRGLPESFLVDKHGVVRYHLTGPLTPEVYARIVGPLLITLQGEP
ncbi:MAG: redoxin family protein [Alphaproteobacteria bacterium]